MWNSLFVVLGAALWATDTLFRQPLTRELSAVTLVYFEHLFAVTFSFVWVVATAKRDFFPGLKPWIGAIFIGVFGSALATVLFTESFHFVNPSVAVLLQKIQPIFVIFLSSLFLGEKITPDFMVWSAIALLSAFFLSFPKGFHLSSLGEESHYGAFLAIGAAFFWAISTVVGKAVLSRTKASVLSFWRFTGGLGALWAITRIHGQARIEIPFVATEWGILKTIAYMALIPGFLGVLLYYRGLRGVPASAATLLELAFPLTAIYLNSRFLGLHLDTIQIFSAGVLVVSMIGVSLSTREKS